MLDEEAVDGVEKMDELLMPVTLHVPADDGAVEHVEGGKQRAACSRGSCCRAAPSFHPLIVAGNEPKEAPRSRPLRQSETLATALNKAVAPITPTPGTDNKALQARVGYGKGGKLCVDRLNAGVDCFIFGGQCGE